MRTWNIPVKWNKACAFQKYRNKFPDILCTHSDFQFSLEGINGNMLTSSGEKAICLFDPIIAYSKNKYLSSNRNLIGNVSGYMTAQNSDQMTCRVTPTKRVVVISYFSRVPRYRGIILSVFYPLRQPHKGWLINYIRETTTSISEISTLAGCFRIWLIEG